MIGKTKANVRSVEVEAQIIRSDGTVVKLGTIASWHKNPIRRFLQFIRRKLYRG